MTNTPKNSTLKKIESASKKIDIRDQLFRSFIDEIFEEIKDIKYTDEENEIIWQEIKESQIKYNTAYTEAKAYFIDKRRKNGSPYFSHIQGALQNYIDNFIIFEKTSTNSTIKDIQKFIDLETKALISVIHHDTQEDIPDIDISTHFNFKKIHGPEVILTVLLITKLPVTDFTNNQLTETESKKLKPYVAMEYNSRLFDLKTLREYAYKLNEVLQLPKEVVEICLKKAVQIKVCDRVDNLKDMLEIWADKPDKIDSKFKETEALVKLAYEVSEHCGDYLKQKLNEQEERQSRQNLTNTTTTTKVQAGKALQKK